MKLNLSNLNKNRDRNKLKAFLGNGNDVFIGVVAIK